MTFGDFFGDLDLLRRSTWPLPPSLKSADAASSAYLSPTVRNTFPLRGPLKSAGGVLIPSLLLRLIPSSRLRAYRISEALVPTGKDVEVLYLPFPPSKLCFSCPNYLLKKGVEAVIVKPKGKHNSQRRKRVIFDLGIGMGAGGAVLAEGWMFTVGVAAAAFLAALSWFKVAGLPLG